RRPGALRRRPRPERAPRLRRWPALLPRVASREARRRDRDRTAGGAVRGPGAGAGVRMGGVAVPGAGAAAGDVPDPGLGAGGPAHLEVERIFVDSFARGTDL